MNKSMSMTLAGILAAGVAGAQDLHETLNDFKPLLGHWTVSGEWSMGFSMEGKTEYVPVLGGRMMAASTYVSDAGQPMYERYWSLMRVLDSGELEATHFSYDGTVNTVLHTATPTEEGLALDATWEMQGPMGAATIDERLIVGEDRCPWKVEITPVGATDPIGEIETEWVRSEAFEAPSDRPEAIVDDGLKPLERLIGSWTIDAEWSDGSTLIATNEYRVGVGGMFVEADTLPSDNGGDVYQRYHTVYDFDPETGTIQAYGFDYTGQRDVVEMTVTENGLEAVSQNRGMELEQTMEFADDDNTLHWIVRVRPVGSDGDWQQVMDGEWKRQS